MQKTKNLVLTALFAAIIFVTTAYIFHIPMQNGYFHIGDSFIYLAASILPTPYAVAAGAIGAALSDGLTGFAIWIIPSIIIKCLTALVFTSKRNTIICKRNFVACAGSMVFCAGGYYLAEVIMLQSFSAPLISIPGYIMQSAVSIIIYSIVGVALDKIKFKEKIYMR